MPSNFDDYVEVKDCIFIKGLRTNANIKDKISDVRYRSSVFHSSVKSRHDINSCFMRGFL